eukprot:c22208_g1_i1 orf=315-1340(-)
MEAITAIHVQGNSLAATIAALQRQLAKKQTFQTAAESLACVLADHYTSASVAEQKLMFAAVCRAATLLQTRYTAPGFWKAGLKLFEAAQQVVVMPVEKNNIKTWISAAYENSEIQKEDLTPHSQADRRSGFLFEGQLTTSVEPPPPAWLVAQNFLSGLVSEQHPVGAVSSLGPDMEVGSSSQIQQEGNAEQVEQMVDGLIQRFNETDDFVNSIQEAIEAAFQEIGNTPQGTPPASKEEVAKLPVVDMTEDLMKGIGEGVECAFCKEVLVIGDKIQEMPCKHSFHPDCLKPWLDQHNSCPICRLELRTDDHDYESKKERDKEFEQERKGAANALRGGEFMYI